MSVAPHGVSLGIPDSVNEDHTSSSYVYVVRILAPGLEITVLGSDVLHTDVDDGYRHGLDGLGVIHCVKLYTTRQTDVTRWRKCASCVHAKRAQSNFVRTLDY